MPGERAPSTTPEGDITRWRESFAIELATADHEVGADAPPSPQGRGKRASNSRARNYNGLIATLRNLTTPSPNCSANGPSVCTPLRTLAVFLPSNMMERSRPLAVISMVLHLPPALGIGSTSA